MKILLELSFVGTRFYGWQVQPNVQTVAGTLQAAAERVVPPPVAVIGCSRTDAGVHARQYFATVEFAPINIPPERLVAALNSFLPPDIVVKSAAEVAPEFNPRFAAVRKEYEYTILNSPLRDPFALPYVWHIYRPLDTCAMAAAVDVFVGTHDFAAFMSAGSSVIDTVRTVSKCDLIRQGDYVKINIAADGFLYNMVRIVVGGLVAVGEGSLTREKLAKILEQKIRRPICQTAPPQGLCLHSVQLHSVQLHSVQFGA